MRPARGADAGRHARAAGAGVKKTGGQAIQRHARARAEARACLFCWRCAAWGDWHQMRRCAFLVMSERLNTEKRFSMGGPEPPLMLARHWSARLRSASAACQVNE